MQCTSPLTLGIINANKKNENKIKLGVTGKTEERKGRCGSTPSSKLHHYACALNSLQLPANDYVFIC